MQKHIKDILDNELVENLDSLVEKEGSTTVEILMHLTELDRRKLFVAFGYSSLFSYLNLRLKYSEGAAMRRIKASRCISEYPEVLELLKRREVNLTTICIFSSILTKENSRELLPLVINKSQAEVERIVSQYRPRGEVRDKMTPISIVLVKEEVPSKEEKKIEPLKKKEDSESYRRSGGEVETIEKVKFTFSASPEFKDKFEEVKRLLSGKYPKGASFEEVFEAGLQAFLDKNSPERRAERREAKKANCAKEKPASSSNGRYINVRECEPAGEHSWST